jgi:small subunit ribosomal protein S16
MAATIRLKRVGRKKQAAFRIVVADVTTAVEGPSIEKLGVYQPRTSPSVIEIDAARTLHWLRAGAKPTDTVRSLLRKTGIWEKYHAGATPEDLEEAVVLVGPAPDRRQTSRRPAPAPAPAATAAPASHKKAEKEPAAAEEPEAEAGVAEAEPEAPEAEPEAAEAEEPDAEEAEEEETPAAEAEADEPDAEEPEAEQASEPEAEADSEPEAEEAAPDEEEKGD